MSKKLRHRKGYYEHCFEVISTKSWTLGETITLKALLDEWWNEVIIDNPKTGAMMFCYKNAYTCDPAYEDGGTGKALTRTLLNKQVKVAKDWEEDADGYPIVYARFI